MEIADIWIRIFEVLKILNVGEIHREFNFNCISGIILLCNFLEEVFSTSTAHNTFCNETGVCMADFVVEKHNMDSS